MADHDNEILVRLGRLERQNRRLRLAVLVGCLTLGGGMLLGFSSNAISEVRTEKISLTDGAGNTCGYLRVADYGVALSLYQPGQPGKAVALLSAMNSDETSLSLHDQAHRCRAKLSVSESGKPSLTFFDESGQAISIGPVDDR